MATLSKAALPVPVRIVASPGSAGAGQNGWTVTSVSCHPASSWDCVERSCPVHPRDQRLGCAEVVRDAAHAGGMDTRNGAGACPGELQTLLAVFWTRCLV